jgi:hypothetical protein
MRFLLGERSSDPGVPGKGAIGGEVSVHGAEVFLPFRPAPALGTATVCGQDPVAATRQVPQISGRESAPAARIAGQTAPESPTLYLR